jgi:hypothetical protein
MTVKTVHNDVSFISNTPDDLHCLQAAFGMIRQYFEPGWRIDWAEWSETTGFRPGKGSWGTSGLLWFHDHGYDVKHMTSFNYPKFAEIGGPFLLESLGPEAGAFEVKFTDVDFELDKIRKMLAAGFWQNRVPTLQDVVDYLDQGYLLRCLINLNILNGKPGYLGHAVVVSGYTEHALIVQDPGLPAHPDRLVLFEDFVSAWANPTTNAEKLDAIKLLAPSAA